MPPDAFLRRAVLEHIDARELVDLASALIRIPSFRSSDERARELVTERADMTAVRHECRTGCWPIDATARVGSDGASPPAGRGERASRRIRASIQDSVQDR
jgi:hypothetical protein